MQGGASRECGIAFPGVSVSRDPSHGITVCTALSLFAPEPLEQEMFGKAARSGARRGNPAGSAPAAFLSHPIYSTEPSCPWLFPRFGDGSGSASSIPSLGMSQRSGQESLNSQGKSPQSVIFHGKINVSSCYLWKYPG